jgi:hypothetical protein
MLRITMLIIWIAPSGVTAPLWWAGIFWGLPLGMLQLANLSYEIRKQSQPLPNGALRHVETI